MADSSSCCIVRALQAIFRSGTKYTPPLYEPLSAKRVFLDRCLGFLLSTRFV
jgi:hypothetical protein